MAKGSGMPKLALARAVTNAPTPMRATWASEIRPPSLRTAGTASMSPAPYRLTPVAITRL